MRSVGVRHIYTQFYYDELHRLYIITSSPHYNGLLSSKNDWTLHIAGSMKEGKLNTLYSLLACNKAAVFKLIVTAICHIFYFIMSPYPPLLMKLEAMLITISMLVYMHITASLHDKMAGIPPAWDAHKMKKSARYFDNTCYYPGS